METQLGLFDAPIARASDPATSRMAGESVAPKLVGLRAEFVRRLREIGYPSTAQEVAAGDESIRKRAKECERMGFVAIVGTRKCGVTGKSATTYWVR